ncbi:MAG: hypothetical protein NTX36_01565 [Proteobacteria bacterium]|nr:hypothetical protein [Pseudomonadota bacterium]
MKKEILYIALINIFIGMCVSFLLKRNILAVVLIVIARALARGNLKEWNFWRHY